MCVCVFVECKWISRDDNQWPIRLIFTWMESVWVPKHCHGTEIVVVFVMGRVTIVNWNVGRRPLLVCRMCATHSNKCEHVKRRCAQNRRSHKSCGYFCKYCSRRSCAVERWKSLHKFIHTKCWKILFELIVLQIISIANCFRCWINVCASAFFSCCCCVIVSCLYKILYFKKACTSRLNIFTVYFVILLTLRKIFAIK